MPSVWLRNLQLNKWFYILPILGVWLAIVVTNFVPETRSLGWDLMDSSFNPGLNAWRSLTGTWQSFQGLGLLGGHGYEAQLPHALLELILSLVLPDHSLRYVFAFGMLLTGALGCFFLTRHVLTHFNSDRFHPAIASMSAMLAAIVYMLHLGAVQTFYVHLEPFIAMYGLFPWALLVTYKLLNRPAPGLYLIFLLLNFGLSMTGFVPPIFVSYGLFIGVTCLLAWLLKPSWRLLGRGMAIMILILIANLYWLGRVGVFTLTQQNYYLDSKLNQITTEEFILKNELYGNLENVALLKSFYFDSLDQNRFGTSALVEPILLPWIQHLDLVPTSIGWGLFGLVVMGFILSLWQLFKRRTPEWSFGILGFITFAGLGIGIPVINTFSWLLRTIPFLNQAFRIPFSKLSMSMTLFYSLAIGVTIFMVFNWLYQKWPQLKLWIQTSLAIFFIMMIAIYSWPSFQGHYLYQGAKVKLPHAYQTLFDYLKTQSPQAKIANFPILTYTGWDMFKWNDQPGYTGSGFYWYAVPQSFLSRTFDVWSPYNETYRQEMVQAVYSQNKEAFLQILRKYEVSFILIDESVIIADNSNAPLFYDQLATMVENLPDTELVLKQDFLSLYEIQSANSDQPVSIPSELNLARAMPTRIRQDRQFEIIGNWLEGSNYIFPFSALAQEKIPSPTILETEIELATSLRLPEPTHLAFVIPDFIPGQAISFNVFGSNSEDEIELIFQPILPEYKVNDTVFNLNKPQVAVLPLVNVSDKLSIDINEQSFSYVPSSDQSFIGMVKGSYLQPMTIEVKADPTTASSSAGPMPTQELLLTEEFWSYYQTFELPLTLNDQYSIEVKVPIQKIEADLKTTNLPVAYNCDYEKRGEVEKSVRGQGVAFVAKHGAAVCDSVTFGQVANDQSYILHVKGKNISGQSPKLFVENLETRHIDLEVRLSEGEFSDYFILLPSSVSNKGYTISWEIRSFGQEESQNQIDSIALYTYPTSLLSGSYLQRINQPPITQTGQITNLHQLGTGLYWFDIQSDRETWLELSQAYDPAWAAIKTETWRGLIHNRYNGWANAWLVPAGQSSLILIYTPQLLTWLGYTVLVIGIVLLTAKWLFHRYKNSRPSRL